MSGDLFDAVQAKPSAHDYLVLILSMFDGYLFADDRFTPAQIDKIRQAYRVLWEVGEEMGG